MKNRSSLQKTFTFQQCLNYRHVDGFTLSGLLYPIFKTGEIIVGNVPPESFFISCFHIVFPGRVGPEESTVTGAVKTETALSFGQKSARSS